MPQEEENATSIPPSAVHEAADKDEDNRDPIKVVMWFCKLNIKLPSSAQGRGSNKMKVAFNPNLNGLGFLSLLVSGMIEDYLSVISNEMSAEVLFLKLKKLAQLYSLSGPKRREYCE